MSLINSIQFKKSPSLIASIFYYKVLDSRETIDSLNKGSNVNSSLQSSIEDLIDYKLDQNEDISDLVDELDFARSIHQTSVFLQQPVPSKFLHKFPILIYNFINKIFFDENPLHLAILNKLEKNSSLTFTGGTNCHMCMFVIEKKGHTYSLTLFNTGQGVIRVNENKVLSLVINDIPKEQMTKELITTLLNFQHQNVTMDEVYDYLN